MARDFLAIANYLDSISHRTDWSGWVGTIANEIREMARDIGG
ncbi:hypothetical protein MICA_575 [Micavibrio aeruginosavorus ARL-13]|uniref:Uncharacterized protein n=2 Tax=Micavibrio aeruginosavorus TaxID=349221 RepID=G2KMY0_MICAA|nr:hypothetical protein MICA_575 [Micavibrio aeruginosavorus ARL-13]